MILSWIRQWRSPLAPSTTNTAPSPVRAVSPPAAPRRLAQQPPPTVCPPARAQTETMSESSDDEFGSVAIGSVGNGDEVAILDEVASSDDDAMADAAPPPTAAPALRVMSGTSSATNARDIVDTRTLALGYRCTPGGDTVGHIMEPADPQVVHRQYEGRWFCDACHGRLGDSVRERRNLLAPDAKMHRCATRGCDFDLCGPCAERYCLSQGDWVHHALHAPRAGGRVADGGRDVLQVICIAADCRSVTIGASRETATAIFRISPGIMTKVPIGATCTLKQDGGSTRLVDTSAEKERVEKELAEKERQLDRLRGNRLEGLSAVQLNELASQVSTALARIHGQQETLRQQVDDCVICVAEPRAVAFQCGHRCCCESCAEGIEKCPMCKAWIVERLRIFS